MEEHNLSTLVALHLLQSGEDQNDKGNFKHVL